MSDSPNTLQIQVRAAGGSRKITSYPFDPMKEEGRVNSRADAMSRARIGLRAWRDYHEFQDEALLIAECTLDRWGRPEWAEVHS